MSNYEFTEFQLRRLGFQEVRDEIEEGDVIYYEYVFNKEDYLNSQFLTTEDISVFPNFNPVKYKVTEDESKSMEGFINFKVLNNVDPDNGEPYLTREEVMELIEKGGY